MTHSSLFDRNNQLFHQICCCTLITLLFVLAGCGTSRKTVPEKEPPQEPKVEAPREQNTEEPEKQEQPANLKKPPVIVDTDKIPETPREMRAAWIASVANIDWPSQPGLPVERQKAELRLMLDRARQLNMNAIILQIRPAADALYDSPHEPWSEFLTGRQGQPPQPYYDPLAFAVKEAHRRGLELHAWFNPFRAYHPQAEGPFAQSHIKNQRPKLVKQYGRYWWIDPGWEEARQYSRNVILDVAKRYDIDGVHLDDYFYPYTEVDGTGRSIPFPDDQSYQAYVQKHGKIAKDDWRRQNINRFVKNLNDELKTVRPHIRFGISPFGIWRPGNPPQIKGFDAYANLYADAKKWFNEGWVDYMAPQLYWSIDKREQSFPALLQWWEQQNTFNRHLWPGLYTSRVGKSWEADEVGRQIQTVRDHKETDGHIHFSMQAILYNNDNIAELLLTESYNEPALVPASYWLSNKRPPQPQASLNKIGDQQLVTFSTQKNTETWLWVLKTRYGNKWNIDIVPGWKQSIKLPAETPDGLLKGVIITAVNEVGNEGVQQLLLPILKTVE